MRKPEKRDKTNTIISVLLAILITILTAIIMMYDKSC